MNPNAHSFKPSLSMNTVETLKYQMQFLLSQIVASKKNLHHENHKLHALHNQMQREYQVLSVETERTKRQEDGCLKQKVILKMMAEYKTRSTEYKKQNSKVMDITACVMTLEQKYTKLQMAAAAAPSSPQSRPATNKKKKSIFYGKQSMSLLDGIEQRNKYQKPSNTLPCIEESEGDSLEWGHWIDEEHVGAKDEKETDSQSVGSYSSGSSETSLETSAASLDSYSQSIRHPEQSPLFVPDPVDIDKLKAEIAYILQMVTYQRIEVMQTEMEQLLEFHGLSIVSAKSLHCLIGCIIDDAVNSQPRLATVCARKYADICSSVLHFCDSVCCDTANQRIEGLHPKILDDIKNLDVDQLLEQQLFDTFCDLQIGADPVKFVNICILMAELYNVSLLRCSTILEVFEAILGERTICRIGQNDIEGLHEIFKRCSYSLRKSKHSERNEMVHYLKVLRNLKSRPKFSMEQNRKVPYMINQIHRYFHR